MIPAHNEAAGIAATVASLMAADYPVGKRRVLVIADNCSDDTADRALQAGAEVLERTDDELRGKGYALGVAFDRALADAAVEGVLVIDADTVVAPNLWRAMSHRLTMGQGATSTSSLPTAPSTTTVSSSPMNPPTTTMFVASWWAPVDG